MKRTTSVALVIGLAAVAVAASLGAVSAVSSDGVGIGHESVEEEPANTQQAQNVQESSEDAADGDGTPGEYLTGVVGSHNAQLEGEISERAYEVRLSNAESDEAKAAVVAAHHEKSQDRLEDLELRLEEIDESRDVGEISEGRYDAEVATVDAEIRAVERQTEAVYQTANDLPETALEDHSVDPDSIAEVRAAADEIAAEQRTAHLSAVEEILGDADGTIDADDDE